jgi:hypothetical protein
MYLSGVVHPLVIEARADLGVMLTPRMANRVDLSRTAWAADTGCFADPEGFDRPRYLDFLAERRAYASTCLFATAPDVVGDAATTWARSEPVLPMIRQAGFPAALVAQDGLEAMPIEWEAFDVLFLGGSTAWKLSSRARDLTREAKARGKLVHMGRVNSLRRLRMAAMKGCDSADGTFLAFAPDHNVPRLIRWLDSLRAAPVLNFGAPK